MMKPTDQTRPSSRRGASGAWNRLRPPPTREGGLDSYGLPSKGETRLNDFKTQETYYGRIVERYMKITGTTKELEKVFASFSTPSTSLVVTPSSSTDTLTALPGLAPKPAHPTMEELSTVLAAMRRLREAMVATARIDQFAQRAYMLNVHAAILCKDWESYHPALVSLLNAIHPHTPLTHSQLHEYVGMLILDQACRQGDLATARETRVRYKYKDRRVDMVLKALVDDNWVVFWKMKKAVNGYQRRIMEFSEQDVRLHALKCIGRSYMSADKRYVERCADRQWTDLVEDGVGWELTDMDKVLIKKPKAK
ncbi:hypothetical protein BS50DRAFT_630134 [Corynespora cassiicola Philippines]|uniref:CSN8/PSMD8/EIF3K domain-containing protein n=1 Tax=Corynespora cassiicola Philippines TaxID=1448308 RepID=A0A2T2P2Y9_CORCC|nr:hypothetical protein BS50DRAFT_630134 [Corynespora cassiicola Philippines]